jgi:hypothetical protein
MQIRSGIDPQMTQIKSGSEDTLNHQRFLYISSNLRSSESSADCLLLICGFI